MKQFQVSSQDSKQRFDKYLKRILPNMGTSLMYKMLRKKNITLNGKKATGSEQIKEGDLIECFFSEETLDKFMGNLSDAALFTNPDNLDEYKKAYSSLNGIHVLYEDEHLLLLNKPAGVLSQKANPLDLSLNEWMIGYLLDKKCINSNSLKHFKPSVCNRLDRNTSGMVICGKTLLGSREMSRLLKERSLQKYYRTYVSGILYGEKTLEGYHNKNSKNNQAIVCFDKPTSNLKDYDKIITSYRSLKTCNKFSYLEIELITGKTHQIRAHMAAIGNPIVGDRKYGSVKEHSTNFPTHQLLHAYRIVFPVMESELAHLSGKEFICEEPDSFRTFWHKYF